MISFVRKSKNKNNMSKIIIFGATGKTGEAVTRFFLNETDNNELILVSANTHKLVPSLRCKKINIDYSDLKEIKKLIIESKPDCVINAAAMTNVDACEDEKKDAMLLNAQLPETLAKASKIVGAHLIHFSTDYIFDGESGPYTEEAIANPISYYGKSKLAGENAILKEMTDYTIIRTNVVYGISNYGKSDFISWLIAKLERKDQLNIITGQYCNPTFVDDLAWTCIKAFEEKRFGVYNISGSTYLNRYELALEVARIFDYDEKLISPIDPKEFKQKAERPEKGGLITLKAESELVFKPSSLKSGLITYKFQLSGQEV